MTFWQQPYRAAISLTFDDGMHSQREYAVPMLEKHGMRGTFYLNPTDIAQLTNSWVPVQKAGHEIGNHTVSHPCGLNIRTEWQMGRHLADWSLAQIEEDIAIAQQRIQECFPEQANTSFAYPCYESDVGIGMERKSYVPVVGKYCLAGRAGGERRGELANDPLYCDLLHLSSWSVERQDGALMIGLVELALAYGRWGVFTFHGIDEGHLPVGKSDFEELLDHLQRRRDVLWVAPVAEIAAYVKQKRTI